MPKFLILILVWPILVQAEPLSLQQALSIAWQQDVRVQKQLAQSAAQQHRAVAATELPDPTLQAKILNLPLNELSFSREPLTQIVFGASQAIPSAKRLQAEQALAQTQAELAEQDIPLLKIQVERELSRWWFELLLAQRERDFLQRRAAVLYELEEIVQSSYELGRFAQSDWLALQLQIVELQDQQQQAEGQVAEFQARLQRWLGSHATRELDATIPSALQIIPDNIAISEKHPELLRQQAKLQQTQAQIRLAQRGLDPDWKLELSYGYRDAYDDVISLGLSGSLPLLSDTADQHNIKAKLAEQRAQLWEQSDVQRRLQAQAQRWLKRATSLQTQLNLYTQRILPLVAEQSASLEREVSTGGSDLNAWLRSRETELSKQQLAAKLEIDLALALVELAYTQAEISP